MNMSHWEKHADQWSHIQPPLRPSQDVVRRLQDLVGRSSDSVLLLGVTPELADAFDHVLAIDKSAAMIANVWPGDALRKHALRGDWLDIPDADAQFSGVVGDGSPNALSDLGEIRRLFTRIGNLLMPGGRFACRLYERPKTPFSLDDLLESTAGPGILNFHAFKWQLAMHIAELTQGVVPVALILRRFEELLPDRSVLGARTGWPRALIDTIDAYRGSTVAYTFPSRGEIVDALPPGIADVQFQDCGDYDLAPFCPILTFRKNAD